MRLALVFAVAVAIDAATMGCANSVPAPLRPPEASSAFGGAWHVNRCETGQTRDCSGFTAYLVQQGDRLWRSHYGIGARRNRMDEGEPASITGTVDHGVANVQIRSTRNHGVSDARISRVADSLSWATEGEIRAGDNGEPALSPDRDVLGAARDADSLRILESVRQQCADAGLR